MKKVLILAYDFPPYVSVGGLRPYNWYQYLKEFNIEPIVVTRQWDNKYGNELDYIAPGKSNKEIIEETNFGTIIQSPYFPNLANKILLKYGANKFVFIRKLISAIFEIIQYVWIVGPKKELYKSANNYLQKNKVDYIIATGDPFVLFFYAKKLSKKYNIPWIADYRDPWSQDIALKNRYLSKNWFKFQEKRNLKSVFKIITVSEFLKSKISQLIPNKEISLITNGYDPTIIEEVALFPQNNTKLSIGYAGTIYNWHPIELFLKTINECIEAQENLEFTINFYGVNNRENLEKSIQNNFPKLKNHVQFYNRMSNKDLLYKLANNNVLLLFNYYSFMGTKIYDYLGIKRKILFCFTNDKVALDLKNKYYHIDESDSPNLNMQADLIQETNSGVLVSNHEQLKVEFINLCNEFAKHKKIECNSINTQKFSRRLQVEILSTTFKKIN